MPITNWSSFLDYVLPDVPSCPAAIATDAIKRAAIRFYRKSKVYTWMHPAIPVVAGTHTYNFSPPSWYVVDEIIKDAFWYDGNRRAVQPRAPLALSDMYLDWQTIVGTPRWYTQESERAVRLVPIPAANVAAGIKFWTWLKPAIAAAGIETEHYEEYRETIAHGAKAMLMEIPTKPYSSPELAGYHWAMFNNGINEAAQRANRGRVDDGEFTMVVAR